MPRESEHAVHTPPRVIVGHCPQCGGVMVHCNDYGVWDIIRCPCGWDGGDDELANMHRIERDFIVCVGPSTKLRLPPQRPVETIATTDVL